MVKERTPKTPASSRSIVRNHSPYCESTGPIVQRGFVAARIRALQGFSNPAQIVTRSHFPPHIYRSRSLPRPSLAPKPVLTSTEMPSNGTVKCFRTEILSRDRNLVSASGGSIRSSFDAPSFQPQEQPSPLEPATPSRLCIRGRGAENPSSNLFTDTVPSPHAQKNQEHITAPSTPCGPLSGIDEFGNVIVENSSPSEEAILSPRAIQVNLVEPRATWKIFQQTEDRDNNYSHEQALKPQGSIADKLGSMVEQGWVEGDPFGKAYNEEESASHTTKSESYIRDTRADSRGDSLSVMPRPKKEPSYSGSLSVSTTETRSELQHSTGEDTPPHMKQKKPRTFVYRGSQKRRQRQAKHSPAVNTNQRSSSDSGIHCLKSEIANSTGKRRAWTLRHLGRSTSNQNQSQREASPTLWPNSARDHRSSEQSHESTRSPPSREISIPMSGFDSTILRDEQLRQDSAALSKITGSRRSSSNTKGSTRSASRTTSFFKNFPWYKVALVDKHPVVQGLSNGGCGNDRTSRSTRPAQHDPTSNQIELSPGASKSHTLVERGRKEDENLPKTKTPLNRGPTDEQAMDAITSYYEASSQPPIKLMTSPQEKEERHGLEHVKRVPERPQDSNATSVKNTEERQLRNPHQIVEDVIGHAQNLIRTGRSSTQPRISSQSGSMATSLESSVSGDVLQSLQPQWPEVNDYSRMQSYTSSYANPTKLHADGRSEQGSSGFETARPESELTASPNPSHQLRSKVVNLSPKRLGARTDPLPAGVHRSEQDGPVRRELKGRGKGIKKIQVTVTFDGAEDFVVEASLKKDGQEHWRTIA
ncbi:MAG: hypothetical protein Q9175_002598 [Cornicularia normoerica]